MNSEREERRVTEDARQAGKATSPKRGTPHLTAAAFLLAFASTVITLIYTGLSVNAPRSASETDAGQVQPEIQPNEAVSGDGVSSQDAVTTRDDAEAREIDPTEESPQAVQAGD